MRATFFIPVLTVGLACLVSGSAVAESAKRCKQMTKQIRQFYQVVKTAEAAENAAWSDATRQHIARLEKRRLSHCPLYMARQQHIAEKIRHDENVEEMKAMMKVAAEAAMKYYTGGLY